MVFISTQLSVTFDNYREYLVYYKATHRNIWTNRLHFVGTAVAAIWAVIGLLHLNFRIILAGVATGYALAWGGDLAIEQRQPASLTHPIWASRANLDTCAEIVKGTSTF